MKMLLEMEDCYDAIDRDQLGKSFFATFKDVKCEYTEVVFLRNRNGATTKFI